MSSRTLAQFMTENGLLKEAAAKPAPAAAPTSTPAPAPAASKTGAAKPAPAPAKTAEQLAADKLVADAAAAKLAADRSAGKGTASQPEPTPDGGVKPRVKNTDPPAQKTAAQEWLAKNGYGDIADPAKADQMISMFVEKAEQNKTAALEKRAAEERARGAILFQGLLGEQTAWGLMDAANSGDKEKYASALKTASLVAAGIGIPVENIAKRAEQLQAATSSPALVDGLLGSAARINTSVVQEVADKNDNQSTTRSVEAIAGTRKAVSGIDEKLLRFVDAWTLPGNPGLNHGQEVDEGKARSSMA